ncbi:MAG: hypothetical protein ABI598_04685 [Chloroflexota bacterium]
MTVPTSNRPRRFSMPDLGDDGVDAAIEAFLSGPQDTRGRSTVAETPRRRASHLAPVSDHDAWMDALHRESQRSERYGRPAAVLIIAGLPDADTDAARNWLTRIEGPILHAIRRGIRETDLVTRAAPATFHVLQPETSDRDARHAAARIVADCEIWLEAMLAPIVLRSAAAAALPGLTLEATLARALEELRWSNRA